MSEQELQFRNQLLERVGHNIALIPDELVSLDFMSDSLLHKSMPQAVDTTSSNGSIQAELNRGLSELFGFPHVIPVSQGRLAEAILFKVISRNGTFIPSNGLFPTTMAHAQFGGATVVEVMTQQALDPQSTEPFKGNLDLDRLEAALKQAHPRWVPCIAIETCNNANGGQPISLSNLKQVKKLADRYGIPIYLDACRIIENAQFIIERENDSRSLWEIVREMCAVADFCTFSAAKDLPVSTGGFLAVRKEDVFHDCVDISLALGGGLSLSGMAQFLQVINEPEVIVSKVKHKMNLVNLLYQRLSSECPLVQPFGGHAVYLDAAACEFSLPVELNPAKAFLHSLYGTYGVRGAENPQSLSQRQRRQLLLRFAVPLIYNEQQIELAAESVLKAFENRNSLQGLQKTGQPPGLSGGMRATYAPIAEKDI